MTEKEELALYKEMYKLAAHDTLCPFVLCNKEGSEVSCDECLKSHYIILAKENLARKEKQNA